MFDKITEGRYWDDGWKLVEGCTKVSPACDNCWALAMDTRFSGSTKVRWFESRLNKPLKRKTPTVYAIWNDLFHEAVPFEFIDKVFAVMALCPQHIFVVLTKRPERLRKYMCDGIRRNIPVYNAAQEVAWDFYGKQECFKFMPGDMATTRSSGGTWWPLPNVWIGVTAENQEQADKRIPLLLATPAAKRIVSIEPVLGDINLNLCHQCQADPDKCGEHNKLDWVICGGETAPGKKARLLEPNWVRKLQDQCKAARTTFFFKGWGSWVPIGQLMDKDSHDYDSDRMLDGKEYNEVPEVK